MLLRQLIVFLSVMVAASIGFTPDATAKYRISVPLTDSVLEQALAEPPVVLAKGGKRPKTQFKQAAKKPTKRTKPTATLNKPIAGQRKISVSKREKDFWLPKNSIANRVTVSRAAAHPLNTSKTATLGHKPSSLSARKEQAVKAKLRSKSKPGSTQRIVRKDAEKSKFTPRNFANDNKSYPPNFGFSGKSSPTALKAGTLIDRYGSERGRYFSPRGTSFESRSMPQALSGTNLKTYRVIKPFKVMSGTIAPWYGQKGGGTQFMSTMTASKLLEKGYIKEVK